MIDGKRILIQELLPWFGDFQGMPVLQAKEVGTNHLAGYIGFKGFGFQNPNIFVDARPDWLELRQIKVFPQYRKGGFANGFLALACHLAAKAKVPLILEPKPTGDKALNEEQLTRWYRLHGFRKLTPEECQKIAHQMMMKQINSDLLFAGFDQQTGTMTGKRRYSLSQEEIKKMDSIPEDTRIAFYKKHHEWGHALERNRDSRLRFISKYMLRDPSISVRQEWLRQFKVVPKFVFPNSIRLKMAWDAIHKSGKQPRKRPQASPPRI
ncbi:MAG: hypothetical protein HYW50_03995 [Candidatus Diapherotrites archaeon]|nr:hypothetical protein [Candidatus Diapherotrites archaeon]